MDGCVGLAMGRGMLCWFHEVVRQRIVWLRPSSYCQQDQPNSRLCAESHQYIDAPEDSLPSSPNSDSDCPTPSVPSRPFIYMLGYFDSLKVECRANNSVPDVAERHYHAICTITEMTGWRSTWAGTGHSGCIQNRWVLIFVQG